MRARARLFIAIATAVAVNILFFAFFIQPRRSNLSAARAQAEQAQLQTQQLRAQLAQLRSLQQQAPKLQSELADFQQLVPDNNEVPHFIFQVQHAADQAGVGFLAIEPETPKAPPEGAQLAEVRISIGASGGYFALQDFVRRLYTLERAVRIDNLTMTTTNGASSDSSGASPAPGASPGTTSTSSNQVVIALTMDARIFFAPTAGASTGGAAPAPAPAPVESTPEASPPASPGA